MKHHITFDYVTFIVCMSIYLSCLCMSVMISSFLPYQSNELIIVHPEIAQRWMYSLLL